MHKIILIDKPVGVTSYSVIRDIKKNLNKNTKIGHAGTLDPFASGLLVILIGKATKLFDYFNKYTKTYQGTFKTNILTDTLDIEGKIIIQKEEITILDTNKISTLYNNYTYLQYPPKYSAVKINGKKAYELARNNIDFKTNPSNRTIYYLNLNQIDTNTYQFETKVSKGTYIRQLVNDIVEPYNTFSTCITLRRTEVGPLSINLIKDKFYEISLIDFLKLENPEIKFNDFQIHLIKNGAKLDLKHTDIRKDFIAVDTNDIPIAFYTFDKEQQKYLPYIIF